MVASPATKSVTSTGNIRYWWVPGTASNPLSVATLGANTTKDITTSLVGSGFTPSLNENMIQDPRQGIRQVLNKRGTFSEEVAPEYVYGDVNDIAQPALAEGTIGFLVVRRGGVPNTTDPAVGQIVSVYTGECGKQMQQPPAENVIDTIKQNLVLNAVTQNLVPLVA